MEGQQNVVCGWKTCSQRFEDDVDMNLHMLNKHMVLLDYGSFEINKRSHAFPSRKRPPSRTMNQAANADDYFLQNIKRTPTVGSTIRDDMQRIGLQSMIQMTERPAETYSSLVLNNPVPPGNGRLVKEGQNQVHEPENEGDIVYTGSSGLQNQHNSTNEEKPELMNLDFDLEFNTEMDEEKPKVDEIHGENPMSGQITKMEPKKNPISSPVKEEIDLDDQEEEIIGDEDETDYQSSSRTPCNQRKLSDLIDDFLMRLNSIKRLGFIRAHKPIYCIVCLKYVGSRQDCNWQHNEQEERIAELYNRRYGPKSPSGKQQLFNELTDMKSWLAEGEANMNNAVQEQFRGTTYKLY